MKTKNSAYVISPKGHTVYIGYITMQRGCPATRSFAESSGKHVTASGVSFVVGENATTESICKAIDILSGYLSTKTEPRFPHA